MGERRGSDESREMLPITDPDPRETGEWLDALDGVLAEEGPARTQALIERLVERAQEGGAQVELGVQTPYINTIPVAKQTPMPGSFELETRLRHYVRWNAMAMVVRANQHSSELGGHVASFASSATLYDVGLNHFFRAPSDGRAGDLVYFQGHSSPGRLRPRLPRGAALGGATRQLPPGSRRARALFVSRTPG